MIVAYFLKNKFCLIILAIIKALNKKNYQKLQIKLLCLLA